MLPIVLDMTGRLAVVVGGGPVGRRKATGLLDAGARVRIVCLEPRPAAADQRLEWLTEPYRADHLAGAALAFAASTPAVDARVIADARAAGVLVNAAGDPNSGDFFLPAVLRRGDFVVTVSTGGGAPHLARRVRERLETEFDSAFGAWVGLLGELRAEVLARIDDPNDRRAVLERLAGWAWLARLRADGVDRTRDAMRAEIERSAKIDGGDGERGV